MEPTRRRLLAGTGGVVLGAVTLGSVTAQDATTTNETDLPVYITNVDAEGETIAITNFGDSSVDLGGYYVDFEYSNEDYSQNNQFPEAPVSVIQPGESITVATGDANSGDIDFGSDAPIINNRDPDTIALLNPEGTAVRTSEDTPPQDRDQGQSQDQGDNESQPDSDAGQDQPPTEEPATEQPSSEQKGTETPAPQQPTDEQSGAKDDNDTAADGDQESQPPKSNC